MDDYDRRAASIKNVLTCGICKKLCKNVIIIEECCHRFCKKCITRKITKEELNVCPECNVDLGVVPLQKIRPDHQVQEIMETLSAKRRECVERGQNKDKSKKDEPKKLAHVEIAHSSNMLIDNPPVPPLPAAVATSSRRKEKSISSLVNTTSPLVVDDHHNVSSSTGIRRRGNPRNANAVRFQDPSKFNNVADQMNNNQIKLGSSTIPPLSQQVESSAAESSKKNKSSEALDRMNELWEPLNNLGTKGVTLDKSKYTKPVPKFTPILINLDDDDENEDEDDDDDDEEDKEYVPSPKIKEHRVRKQNVVQKSNVVPSSSNAKEKGEKGRRGRKKKETNNIPPSSSPPSRLAASGDGGSNNNNNNVTQGGVTDHHQEAAATISRGSRVHPIWFTLLASDNQECPSPLPQISPPYIKIKDANKPASYIKKYLAKKLSLQNEDEVEVRMLGMPIRPALPLKHLADLWLRVAASSNSTDKIIKVGDSAEEFVIVFKYSRCQN